MRSTTFAILGGALLLTFAAAGQAQTCVPVIKQIGQTHGICCSNDRFR